MEVIQVTGYKNSGKTTLASKIIEKFSNQGIKVASLKHHGHGGVPLGIEDTDSIKHLQAGAVISGVEGDGMFQLTKQKPWKVQEMLAFYKTLEIEVVIMEGFKAHPYKKIVLIRDENDLSLLKELTNIKAVVTSLSLREEIYSYPIYKPTEQDLLIEWLTNQLT